MVIRSLYAFLFLILTLSDAVALEVRVESPDGAATHCRRWQTRSRSYVLGRSRVIGISPEPRGQAHHI